MNQVRKQHVVFKHPSVNEDAQPEERQELIVDMRDNKIEYNGFIGGPYWEAIQSYAERLPALKRLMSGA